MIFHTIWDIFVRIPGHFCENIPKRIILDFIYLAQDILNLGVFLLVAILICLKYKPTSKANWYIQSTNSSCKDNTKIIFVWKKVRSTLVRPGRQPWPIDVYFLSHLLCTRKYADRWDETNNFWSSISFRALMRSRSEK